MSQEKLGDALGLTFQQVQKYERAANRIGASRLFEMSRVLDVPVAYFFEGFDPAQVREESGMTEPPPVGYEALALGRDQLEMVSAFQRIGDAATRRHLVDLAKAIGLAYLKGDA